MTNSREMNNGEKRCSSCMRLIPQDAGECPFCGFNEAYYQVEFYQLPIGHTLQNGRYQIGRVIGEGGFGITYIGWDSKFGQVVAVKEFYSKDIVSRYNTLSFDVKLYKQSEEERYQKELEKVKREARTIKQFAGCPGIVRVEDYFEENHTVYIVMEYVEGLTLKQFLGEREGGLDGETCLELFRPLMESLHQIHKRGLIHRDISLDNLMIQTDGALKLLDFGSARAPDQNTASVTVKYGYAPLEQYSMDGKSQGTWTDVYALCVCLWNCLTGRQLEDAKLRKQGDDIWEPVKSSVNISKKQKEAIDGGLELDYRKRTGTVNELYHGLYGVWLEEVKADIKKPEPDREDKERKEKERGKNKLFAAGGILAAAFICIGIGIFWFYGFHEEDAAVWEDTVGETIEETSEEAAETQAEIMTWTDSEGNTFTGNKVDGLIQGSGSCIYANGDKYEGEFADGMREGTGTMKYKNKNRYEGEWKHNVREGTGILYDEEGSIIYKGDYKNDKMEGKGIYYWKDGSYYSGEWKDGTMNGQGFLRYPNGGWYNGKWKDGKQDLNDTENNIRDAFKMFSMV